MTPLVGLIMGSDSDWDTVAPAAEVLTEFGVPFEVGVVSAHRTPQKMLSYATSAHERGLKVIIACAGGAAHLPGMVAAATPLPVIGIPRALKDLDGLDSLLSIVQMPGGVPVATVSIGGAKNAGLLAVRILGAGDDRLTAAMASYQARMAEEVAAKDDALRERLLGEH
ncbi:5-(carboxyamino)imidazole ribonucleotide mutase [Corynebacterium uterequi]|uniref:N5-carboxyaminoimidazole ribonucleotide mutase n=1 Tax=Corynebacterium uterequi TaxID=1072256 RepID=A0A0G3HB07_9CORY|nr:5-(carboxyamino)imidazole ribonucleotide mutase [Corynebacterium uterequi]AKK10509.1 phosphoribosylaminoimidazole carboxylase, PurE protein [Corynebacterium uterequi]